MDCSRTSIRQGAGEVTLVYRRDMKDMPAANEVHEAIEEGVTAIFQAGPVRVVTDDSRATSPASSSSGWRRASPTRPAGAAPSRRPAPSSRSPATASCSRSARAPSSTWIGPGSEGVEATKQRRLKADAVTFETGRPGRLRHRRRADRRGDRRPGHRRGPPRRLRGRRLPQGPRPDAIRTRQTLAEPQPEFLSIVPFTSEVKEPRYRMTAMEAEERNHSYIEYELPYTPRGRRRRVDPLPPVHLRGDRLLRPAPPRASSTARRSRRSSRSTTRAPATGA